MTRITLKEAMLESQMTTHRTPYADLIERLAPEHDWRHVEAFMRIERGTLDHLSPRRFAAEVSAACFCIREGGVDFAEKIARSYGL